MVASVIPLVGLASRGDNWNLLAGKSIDLPPLLLRVRVPIQPSSLPASWKAVLSPRPASSRRGTGAVPPAGERHAQI